MGFSGCNEAGQIDENLKIFDTVGTGIMTAEELKLIDDVRAAYISRTKIGCTGCRYCMPCPNGVDIPGVFSVWNHFSLYETDPKADWNMMMIRKNDSGADKCVACGACEAACPQHLSIIDGLRDAWRDIGPGAD